MGYIWFYTLAWCTGVQVDVYLSCISFCVSLVHFHLCITCVSLSLKLFVFVLYMFVLHMFLSFMCMAYKVMNC